MRILVGTSNKGKLAELRRIFADLPVDIVGLDDVGIDHEVVEDAPTFEGNARKKAIELAKLSGLPTLADDSGLEVDALDGAPGVYSARYAGPSASDKANNDKLLSALSSAPDRSARFRCVLALSDPDGTIRATTEGVCAGVIAMEPRGEGGFGYDPLFIPDAEPSHTMGELAPQRKNELSHRGKAAREMAVQIGAKQ